MTIPFTPTQIAAVIGMVIFIVIIYTLGLSQGYRDGCENTFGFISYVLEQTGIQLKIVDEDYEEA